MIGSMEIPPSERKANLKQAPPPLKPLRNPRSEKPVPHAPPCRRRRHVHRPDDRRPSRCRREAQRAAGARGAARHVLFGHLPELRRRLRRTRKSVVPGKSVYVRRIHGGSAILKKKKK